MKPKTHDLTIDGRCSNCGNCCSNLLPLSDREIKDIRAYIKSHGIRPQRHLAVLAAPMADLICPFLDDSRDLKCTIYHVRPEICRAFVCSKTPDEIYEDDRALMSEKRYARDVYQTFFGGRQTV